MGTKKQDALIKQFAYWEEKFPGKATALMEYLAQFYEKQELKPELPDSRERARESVFWTKVNKVETFRYRLEDQVLAEYAVALQLRTFDNSLSTYLARTLDESQVKPLNAGLWFSLLRSLLEQFHKKHVGTYVQRWEPGWESFVDLLLYPSAFILADKPEEAAKFKPIHQVLLAGSFPFGLDRENNLIVLTA
ncbi:MAG: hypothetical protein WC641_07990 [Patescibacteria group bacterium]